MATWMVALSRHDKKTGKNTRSAGVIVELGLRDEGEVERSSSCPAMADDGCGPVGEPGMAVSAGCWTASWHMFCEVK